MRIAKSKRKSAKILVYLLLIATLISQASPVFAGEIPAAESVPVEEGVSEVSLAEPDLAESEPALTPAEAPVLPTCFPSVPYPVPPLSGIAYHAAYPPIYMEGGLLEGRSAVTNIPPFQGGIIGEPGDYFTRPPYDTMYVSSDIPELTGYSFAGWNTSESGRGDSWEPGAEKTFRVGDHRLDLYTQWTPEKVSIVYDLNTGNSPPGADPFVPASGSEGGFFGKPVGSIFREGETYIHPGSPTRKGYTFTGWYESHELAAVGSPDEAWNFETAVLIDATSKTFYAGWKPIVYSVSFAVAPGGTLSGDSFFGGVLAGSTWSAAGISVPSPVPDAHRHFIGWFPFDPATAGEFPITSAMTFTALFDFDSHRVAYHGSGHTRGSVPAAATYPHGSIFSVKAPGTLAKSGSTFMGWATRPGSQVVAFAPGARIEANSDIDLYAVWKAEPGVSVGTLGSDDSSGDRGTIKPSLEEKKKTQTVTKIRSPYEDVQINIGDDPADSMRLESQTGEILRDISSGNVPLGGVSASGVWSCGSLLLAVLGALASLILMFGSGRKRKIDLPKNEKLLRLLASLAGVSALVVFRSVEDSTNRMVFIDESTVTVAGIVALQALLIAASIFEARRSERST